MLVLFLQLLETEDERKAFTEIYYKYEQLVFKVSTKYLFNASYREDCVQETFLELIKSFKKFICLDSEKQKSYLMTICRRCAFRINNEATGNVSIDDIPQKILSTEIDLNKIEINAVVDIIKKLDETYRIPMEMKYYEDKTVKEIADFLSISVNTVKQRLFRGRKMIFESLGTDDIK